jgi:hypothetical protein
MHDAKLSQVRALLTKSSDWALAFAFSVCFNDEQAAPRRNGLDTGAHVMASDLVVALGKATVHGTTLFGANDFARPGRRQRLQLIAGRNHPLDDPVRATYLRLPQARQTYSMA